MGPEGISFRPRSTPLPPLGTLTELRIEGMDCGNCARSVTEALQGVPGVSRSVVNLQDAMARTYWMPGQAPEPARLIEAVQRAGYQACLAEGPESPSTAGSPPRNTPPNPWTMAVWLGVPATLLLLTGDWIGGWGMQRGFQTLSLVLASTVQAGWGGDSIAGPGGRHGSAAPIWTPSCHWVRRAPTSGACGCFSPRATPTSSSRSRSAS